MTLCSSLTCRLHEGTVKPAGEQWLLQLPQEVLEQAGDRMNILHPAQRGSAVAPACKPLLQVLHHTVRARDSVEASLGG